MLYLSLKAFPSPVLKPFDIDSVGKILDIRFRVLSDHRIIFILSDADDCRSIRQDTSRSDEHAQELPPFEKPLGRLNPCFPLILGNGKVPTRAVR